MKSQKEITPAMARAARGNWTQQEAARFLECHWRTIQNYETGKTKMRQSIYKEYLRMPAKTP